MGMRRGSSGGRVKKHILYKVMRGELVVIVEVFFGSRQDTQDLAHLIVEWSNFARHTFKVAGDEVGVPHWQQIQNFVVVRHGEIMLDMAAGYHGVEADAAERLRDLGFMSLDEVAGGINSIAPVEF